MLKIKSSCREQCVCVEDRGKSTQGEEGGIYILYDTPLWPQLLFMALVFGAQAGHGAFA